MRYLLVIFLVSCIFIDNSIAEDFYPEGPWISEITDDCFVCKSNDGKTYKLDPKKILVIKIITNDKGPFEEDVFYKLEGPKFSCYLPQVADPDGDFLKIFQALKGFDNEAVIKAMTSTENKVFIVWDRSTL